MMSMRSAMWLLIALCVAGICGGCASTGGHARVQLADDADSLRVGMSIEEARQRYGEPLKQYATAFGYGSDDQWDGFVLVYGGARDPRFLHYKQPLKHRLVFALTATDTLLNSWDFDEAEEVLLKDPW